MISTIKFPKVSYTGWGSLEKVKMELEEWKPNHILIVTDYTLQKMGLIDEHLLPLLEGFSYMVYTDIEPEPSLACGQRLVDFTRNGEFDFVIGMGGGSTLDLAKLTAVISQNEGSVDRYLNLNGTGNLERKGLPKLLIPTTSGTGSEVTNIAVLSLEGTKDVVAHDYLLADAAIVDPQLTMSVPKRITAATGIDALTHAVEAFLSVHANEVTDALAIKAMELISSSIRQAVHHGDDREAREAMSLGSYTAGLAFFNAGVAGVHALAYPLGSQFKLPHGESNAVLLPYVMSYIAPSCQEKMQQVHSILNESSGPNGQQSEDTFQLFLQLVQDVGLPTSLKEYGISEEKLEELTEDAAKQTRLLARSPMPLEKEDIFRIYNDAYPGVKTIRHLLN